MLIAKNNEDNVKSFINKNKDKIFLFLLIIQFFSLLFIASNKKAMHIDENYSYILSNSKLFEEYMLIGNCNFGGAYLLKAK